MVNARNPLSVRALLGTLNGLVGEVQATPTANTLLARVKAIADALPGIGQKTAANSMSIIPASDMGTIAVSAASLPLPSGAATSAKQDDLITAVGGQAAQVQIEITRPADTTQYAANDAIADNDPSITTHLLSGMARANGGSGRIVRACIKTDNVSWTNAVRVVVYKAAPAGGFIADNAAFDAKYADKASIVGSIMFPGFTAMGAGAAGGIRAAVVEGLYIPYECGAGVSDLYFQIYIPSGTPTPASGQKFYLHLGIEQD